MAPTDVIAVNAAGAIPYFAERPAIDMLGLNDVHIAHRGQVSPNAPAGHKRSDANYILERRPAFIVLSPIVEEGQPLVRGRNLPSIEALLANDELTRDYMRVRINALSSHEVILARADVADGLRSAGLVSSVP